MPDTIDDSDGDGMPEWWEALYLLDPHNADDALLDSDGDGATNLEEYQNGTNPRDPTDIVTPGGSILPDTGQTRCYDNSAEITCPLPGQAFYGQDAQYHGSAPAYQDNGNGTVSDLNTGLMWMQATADTNSDGTIDSNDELTWQAAIDYCAGSSYAGHSDWRLPSYFELGSIVDYGRYGPAINPVFMSQSSNYCSATTDASYALLAGAVGFTNGHHYLYYKTSDAYVRCVRSGQ